MARECGACTACCTLQGVKEVLGEPKPAGVPCPQLCSDEKGCGIYADRPTECATYQCLWIQGLAGELWDRPDFLGVVFEHQNQVQPPFILGRVSSGRRVNQKIKDLGHQLQARYGLRVAFTYPSPDDGWKSTKAVWLEDV